MISAYVRRSLTIVPWILLLVAVVPDRAASAGDAGAPAAEASPVSARPPFRILEVVPAVEGEASGAKARARRPRARTGDKGPRRAIRVRFSLPVTLGEVSGSLVCVPTATLDWEDATVTGGDALVVPGSFAPGQAYTLVVTQRFRDASGKQAIAPIPTGFTMPRQAVSLSFVGLDRGRILERHSRQFLHVAVRDAQKLRVRIARVPLAALAPSSPPIPRTGPLEEQARAWEARQGEIARALAGHSGPFAGLFDDSPAIESEVFAEPGPPDRDRRASLPLAWRQGARRGGTYQVEVVAADEDASGATPQERLQITDLALSYKLSRSGILVWATRLGSAEVAAGARVFFVTGDGTLLHAGSTDARGLLRVEAGRSLASLELSGPRTVMGQVALDTEKVQFIHAVHTIPGEGDGSQVDTAWLAVDEHLLGVPESLAKTASSRGPSRAAAGAGRPEPTREAELTRAHVFTERGIYRPGDTVRFKATLRRFEEGRAVLPAGADGKAAGCRVTVHDPEGKEVRRVNVALSPFGTAMGTFPTRAHSRLGEYRLAVEDPGGTTVWGQTTFRVEEFIPPRHKVDVTFKEEREAGRTTGPPSLVRALVRGGYYAGGPVKHGKVRWRVTLAGTRHKDGLPRGFSGGTDAHGEPDLVESGEATLDGSGAVVLELPVSGEVAAGRRSLEVAATVLDFDARAASGSGSYTHTPAYIVGISQHPSQLDEGEPIELEAIVVDRATGRRVDRGEVSVALLNERYVSVEKRNEAGDFYWTWDEVLAKAFESPVPIKDGTARIALNVASGGRQQVEVTYRTPDGGLASSSTTFEVGWTSYYEGNGNGGGWRSHRLHKLPVHPDRREYVPGETARLRVHAPRPAARYLVSVEREGLLETVLVEARPGQDTLEVPIREEYAPNVYVSVLALHPRGAFPIYASEADTGAPSWSHGYATVEVRREHGGLRVAVTGAGEGVEARPGARHRLRLTVTGADGRPAAAEVALGVVDESVLALTGYQSPTLDALFSVVLPLAVRTGDMRTGILFQTPYRAIAVRPLSGGDGGEGSRSRTREWFDPVALFEPALVTDASGQAQVEFTLPDTMTTYRVYALAVDRESRHGARSAPLLVRKPFYLEAGLPRAFTDGDRGRFVVAVFNGTARPGRVRLSVASTRGLSLSGPDGTVAVGAGDRASVPIQATASLAGLDPKGTDVRVTLAAAMDGHEDSVALTVPLRARYVMRTQAVMGEIEPGTPVTASIPIPADAARLPPEVKALAAARLELSGLASLRLAGALSYLLQYPYGCVEQTSSGVFPLAVLRDLVRQGLVPMISLARTDEFLQKGVERLLAMQTSSGGFGYWPGYQEAHPWGSAYAALALTHAHKAGIEVPAHELGRALDYLEQEVKKTDEGYESVRPLSATVLAMNGRKPPRFERTLAGLHEEALRRARSRASWRAHEDVFLTLLAMAHAGRRSDAAQKLAQVVREARGDPGGRRRPAATGPDEEDSDEDQFDPWCFSSPTRELAVGLLAITEVAPESEARGEYASLLLSRVKGTGAWTATHDTGWSLAALAKLLARSAPPGADVTVDLTPPAGAPMSVRLGARTTHTVSLDPAAFLGSPSVALSLKAPPPVYYRLEATYPYRGPDVDQAKAGIERRYTRMAGPGEIRVGDLVEVELLLRLNRRRNYLALVDPLPAGLVAVNTTLKTEERLPQRRPWDDTGDYEEGTWVSPYIPSRLELRDDRVIAFSDDVWRGRQRFTYVARAVCEGTFVVPPAKAEPMYEPARSIFSPEGILTIRPSTDGPPASPAPEPR